MVHLEQEPHRSLASTNTSTSTSSSPFLALGSGGRPIGSLLNPYDAVLDARTRQRCNSSSQGSTASTPSLRSDAYYTDELSSCRSTPSMSLASAGGDRRNSAPSLRSPRESCLAYEEEEVCFIWYHRVDLEKEWVDVRRAFNAQFPTRQRSGFQGIQCRYYRYLYDTWKVPKIRQQKRMGRNGAGENAKKYGLRQWTKRSFPWMEGEVAS